MSFKKFKTTEVFHNTIITNPKYVFHIHGGKAYLNKEPLRVGNFSNKEKHTSEPGYVSLYEMNVNRPADGLVYPFITKDGSRTAFSTVSLSSFNSNFQFGDKISGKYPLSASISRIFIPQGVDYQASTFSQPAHTDWDNKEYILALEGPLKSYTSLSPHFEYSSSLGDKGYQKMNMICVPSIFYGSSIKKGSLKIKTFVTGALAAECSDHKKNGEMIETTGSSVGSVAGVVLYDQGIVLLTGSWNMPTTNQEPYISDDGNSYPKWVTFGAGLPIARKADNALPPGSTPNTSYQIEFEGVNPVPTITMLAHAEKAELNYSSNPTYVASSSHAPSTLTGDTFTDPSCEIKNIAESPYVNHSASFEKTTYITKIGIYDDQQNLLGIATLANPVRKREKRDYTFKLKLDF
jgi:hypothetical protein